MTEIEGTVNFMRLLNWAGLTTLQAQDVVDSSENEAEGTIRALELLDPEWHKGWQAWNGSYAEYRATQSGADLSQVNWSPPDD